MKPDLILITQLLSVVIGLIATIGGVVISYQTLKNEINKTKNE